LVRSTAVMVLSQCTSDAQSKNDNKSLGNHVDSPKVQKRMVGVSETSTTRTNVFFLLKIGKRFFLFNSRCSFHPSASSLTS
jgi:hypothetical protein